VAVLRRKSGLGPAQGQKRARLRCCYTASWSRRFATSLAARTRPPNAIQVRPDGAAPLAWMGCEEHRAPIEAGAPIRWDPELTDFSRGALVLGTDLPTVGLTITEVIAIEEHGLVLGPDGGQAVTLVLEKLNVDGSHEDLRLTLGYEVMDHLGSIFEAYWRRRPGQGSPPED
jgi:hypothetical protein